MIKLNNPSYGMVASQRGTKTVKLHYGVIYHVEAKVALSHDFTSYALAVVTEPRSMVAQVIRKQVAQAIRANFLYLQGLLKRTKLTKSDYLPYLRATEADLKVTTKVSRAVPMTVVRGYTQEEQQLMDGVVASQVKPPEERDYIVRLDKTEGELQTERELFALVSRGKRVVKYFDESIATTTVSYEDLQLDSKGQLPDLLSTTQQTKQTGELLTLKDLATLTSNAVALELRKRLSKGVKFYVTRTEDSVAVESYLRGKLQDSFSLRVA